MTLVDESLCTVDFRKYGFESIDHVVRTIDIIEHSHCPQERQSVTTEQYRYLFIAAYTSSVIGLNYRSDELDDDGYAHMWWSGSDNFSNFVQATLDDPVKKAQLINDGWADASGNPAQPIDYRVNSDGFRCDHFDHRPGIAFFGCSFTYGVGLHEHQTWAHKVAKHYDTQCWNLSAPGHGLVPGTFYAVNFLDQALPNLKAIAVLQPPMGRVPLVQRNGAHTVGFGSLNSDIEQRIKHLSQNSADRSLAKFLSYLMGTLMLTSDFQRLQCIKTLEMVAKIRNIPFVIHDCNLQLNHKFGHARDTHHNQHWQTAIANLTIRELDKYLK